MVKSVWAESETIGGTNTRAGARDREARRPMPVVCTSKARVYIACARLDRGLFQISHVINTLGSWTWILITPKRYIFLNLVGTVGQPLYITSHPSRQHPYTHPGQPKRFYPSLPRFPHPPPPPPNSPAPGNDIFPCIYVCTIFTTYLPSCSTHFTTYLPRCSTHFTTYLPRCSTHFTTYLPRCSTHFTTYLPRCSTHFTTYLPRCSTHLMFYTPDM